MSPSAPLPLDQHNVEIERNRLAWQRKPVLQRAYRDFHRRIAAHIDPNVPGKIVELGSGIGNIRDVIADCVRTDLFANPWIDQVENAYALTFEDGAVSHLILFDVFHHLEHPRTALRECRRVLAPHGRLIIFDPYVSLAGRLVYGPLHHEPIGFDQAIAPDAPASFDPSTHASTPRRAMPPACSGRTTPRTFLTAGRSWRGSASAPGRTHSPADTASHSSTRRRCILP